MKKKFKVIFIVMLCVGIIGCEKKEKSFNEEKAYDSSGYNFTSSENSNYKIITNNLINKGYKLEVSTIGHVGRSISISSAENPMDFAVNVVFEYSSVDFISITTKSELYKYIPVLKKIYSDFENEVESDISIYNNVLNNLELTEEKLIHFAEWYFEQHKHELY